MVVICSFALVRVRLRRSSGNAFCSLFHISTDLYFMELISCMCVNYQYKGTLVHCRTCSMQMLSVQFFEISHKRRGDFFFKYVLWCQERILEWYEVSYFKNFECVLKASFTLAPFGKKLTIRIALSCNFSISWNNLVLDCPQIWHAYMRWELNREKYIVFRRDLGE